jgi:hypothetical protein
MTDDPGERKPQRISSRSDPDPARVVTIADPEVVMRLAHRLVLALLIVVVDTVAFAVPLAALLLAYVLLARPPWRGRASCRRAQSTAGLCPTICTT